MRSSTSRFPSSLDDDEDLSSSPQAPLLPLRLEEDIDQDDVNAGSSSSSRSRSTTRRRRPSAARLSSWTGHLQRIGAFLSPPTSKGSPGHYKSGRRSVRRRVIQCTAILAIVPLALVTCSVLWWGGIPHSYSDIRKMERNLPQHRWKEVRVDKTGELLYSNRNGERVNWEEDAGEGYLKFPDHIWGHGFNNVLEESLLTAQLAHLSNRAFVFEDYVWSKIPFPYTLYDYSLRPTRIPINAFVSGFMAGAKISSDAAGTALAKDSAHLSISAEYYKYICPPSLPAEHRVVLSADDAPDFADGTSRMDWWVNRIKTVGKGKRCVEIREGDTSGRNGKRLFDFLFFGSKPHLAPLVPDLLKSPVLKHFSWSNLVDDAVSQTIKTLGLSTSKGVSQELETNDTSPDIIPGLLAIHLRRGDYSRHCKRLSKWHSGFMGFNLADGVKDQLDFDGAVRDYERQSRKSKTRRRSLSKRALPGGVEDTRLKRRWWYWAGKSGQRLTSAEGSLSAVSMPSSDSPSLGKSSKDSATSVPDESIPSTGNGSGAKEKFSGVRIVKEDFDYSRARTKLGSQVLIDEGVVNVDDLEEDEDEDGPKEQLKLATPAKWMWWGNGSKRISKSALDTLESRSFDDEDDDLEDEVFDSSPRGTEEERLRNEIISRYILRRCLPTIDEVVQRAKEVRHDWSQSLSSHQNRHPLNKILLLSNGWPSFLLELSAALEKDGWEVVDPEESVRHRVAEKRAKDIDVAVDMALAEKAEVFLGNGYSTLTGNVILLRMLEGDDGEMSRLL